MIRSLASRSVINPLRGVLALELSPERFDHRMFRSALGVEGAEVDVFNFTWMMALHVGLEGSIDFPHTAISLGRVTEPDCRRFFDKPAHSWRRDT
jgi:hypothetical protein